MKIRISALALAAILGGIGTFLLGKTPDKALTEAFDQGMLLGMDAGTDVYKEYLAGKLSISNSADSAVTHIFEVARDRHPDIYKLYHKK